MPVPKRRRIIKLSKKASSEVGEDEVTPLVVNVESSKNDKVYARRSRTPPRDSVPKADLHPMVSHEEQHDDVPSAHEAQRKPIESKDVRDHLDTEEEEFHEGDLHSVEAEIQKIMQSPLVAYVDSPVRIEEVPPREEETVKDPSPEQEEEHAK